MEPTAPTRERYIFFSSVTTGLALVPTAYAAYISNSTVLFADLLRCCAEFLAILLSWLVLRQVARDDRTRFNYGFGKLEQLASSVVALALLVGCALSSFSAYLRFVHPEPLEGTIFGLVLAVLSLFGNAFLWGLNFHQGKHTGSSVMKSQGNLFRAKTFATLVVIVSLSVSMLFTGEAWSVYVDPIGSTVLALFLLHAAVTMLFHIVPELIDCAVDEKAQLVILEALIRHEPKYIGLEQVHSRRSGNRLFIELGLSFRGTELLKDVQQVTRIIRDDLESKLSGAEVTVVPSAYERE